MERTFKQNAISALNAGKRRLGRTLAIRTAFLLSASTWLVTGFVLCWAEHELAVVLALREHWWIGTIFTSVGVASLFEAFRSEEKLLAFTCKGRKDLREALVDFAIATSLPGVLFYCLPMGAFKFGAYALGKLIPKNSVNLLC